MTLFFTLSHLNKKVVNDDWSLGKDSCSSLCSWQVADITKTKDVFELIVLQSLNVYIKPTVIVS